MAAHSSGGVDWALTLKPFLTGNYGSHHKCDVLNLVKGIFKSENEILDHDESFESFYISLVALAADSISGQAHSICQGQISQVTEACHILIRFILNRLENSSNADCKILLPPLKSLCEGKSEIPSFDQVVLTSVLKNAKYPEHVKSSVTGDKDSPKSEMKRSRSDLSTVILQQLTVPLTSGNFTWTPLNEEQTDCTQMFVKANVSTLQALNAGEIILNVCTNLPLLSRYRIKYEESTLHNKPLYLPVTLVEAQLIKNCFPQIAADISILSHALSLPLLEPLTPNKIIQLSQCAMSALYCAVLTSIAVSVMNMTSSGSQKTLSTLAPGSAASASATPSKDSAGTEGDSNEDYARTIVDKGLEIFTVVGNIFKTTTRGRIYQNHLCMGTWLLISGIQGAMGASASKQSITGDESGKGKSPSRTSDQTPMARVNLFKVQQGFGVLNAAIAGDSLILLTELIEDLKIEARTGDDASSNSSGNPEPAGFDILGQYTSLQRVVRILNSVTLQQLLTFLATISYRKACNLRRANTKNAADSDQISYSDSTTYFNDTISCSEDSETEEEDSEGYLGLWFKETLSPEANDEQTEPAATEKPNETHRGTTLVWGKDEPHEYLELSAQIFTFLDKSLGSNHKCLNKYVKAGLSEQQMALLANILKDLDRDAARGEPDTSGSCAQWPTAILNFSGSIGRYLHNLISGGLLNEWLQSSLLLHLGVSPWTQDSNIWPLQVYSRTLAVLVQIILLKPSQEKEAACLSVWHRLVNTLVEGVCSSHAHQSDADYEDLNVEHAQLLLFLYHSLNLMQKKSILLLTAGGVIRCAEVCRSISTEKPLRDHQIILLSRLLLFLEYLMKHLYNAPILLLELVRWNLFSVISVDSNQKVNDLVNNKTKLMSFCRKDIEDKHRKLGTDFGANSVRPKFYSLAVIDQKIQQEFKLDGLAWNFILCTPDRLKYPLLIDALIDILGVTDICMNKVSIQTLCAVNYCFGLCWKLLLGLPPSTPHVEALMQDKVPTLHSLIWSVRCLHPVAHSHYLIVNSLVKQGMYTQYAENLWSKVTEHVSNIKYSLKETISGLDSFIKTFQTQSPRLSKIILLDSLVSHLEVIWWAEKNAKTKLINGTSSANGTGSTPTTTTSTTAMTVPTMTSPTAVIAATVSELTAAVVASTSTPLQTPFSVEGSPPPDTTREELNREVLLKLLDVIEIVRDCTFKTMLKSLSGPVPTGLLESLIAITSSKNSLCADIADHFTSLLTGQDKETITVNWRETLVVTGSEDTASSNTNPVEVHTLSVIEAHLNEVTKQSNYSILLSLKHALKSLVNLLYYLLDNLKEGDSIGNRIKELIMPLLFDIRTEFLHSIGQKCLERHLGGDSSSDAYQLLMYSNILRHSYPLLIEYAENSRLGRSPNLDETILHKVLSFWETMLEKPMGMRAMQSFFYATKRGSLVELLLSFSGTNLSQVYATKILQFFEKLFQCSEHSDAQFKLDELCTCVSELGNVEQSKLKNWLSHILLGPGGTATANISSNNSSNVQTPTNMATVSAIPSISDQMMQSSEMILDGDDMEIDEECTGGAAGGIGVAGATANITWQPVASTTTNRSATSTPNEESLERNGRLLQSLTKYIVSENRIAPTVSGSLFQALIQIGQNLLCPTQDAYEFTDLLQVMVTLADAGQGRGHSLLFGATIDWLEISKAHVLERSHLVGPSIKSAIALENVTILMRYMGDLLEGVGATGGRTLNPPWDEEHPLDADDLLDDINAEDDDSAVEDSDEDTLGNKLCTFSITQKEFMNQHWYHCHTCKMVDGVGVCSVCARVCHRNHDISYAKYGNFFCDCGAKEDGTCQALSRRSPAVNQPEGSILSSSVPDGGENVMPSSLRRRASSPPGPVASYTTSTKLTDRGLLMAKVMDASKDALTSPDQWRVVVRCLLDFFDLLMPAVKENCAKHSTVGCHLRAKNALERLHQPEKTFSISDEVMVATLGSQEGAFENVRMSYSGEQGQTIRQLLSTNLVRRVALCCLASPHGKRQHLAVSHEKGKVTILQLSALLKQADAAKRKLTLTRLASAPIPCTVLSLASNPANEDFLAVCGLKECHILTFSSSGAANEHIVLTPQLETGNFIKRAIWLPGSQTKLALVTADFVKIYDLAEDTYSPLYYFLVPSGKIRDCTFTYHEDTYYMLLMASSGYIYTQPLADESLAKHGAFYVTNTLELDHPHIKDANGQIGGGGVSIYYSHVLQMLFFSYSQGRSFMAPLVDVNIGVKCVMHLQTGPNTKNSSKGPPQPLCQWTEVAGHPGLICAMMQTCNNPVIFMLRPDGVVMQEIKAQSSKSKIMDMVAIRHAVSGSEKTTLILLCEDGSLRIFAAHPEHTNFWLSPEVQPIGNQMYSSMLSVFGKNGRRSKQRTNSNKMTTQNNLSGTVAKGSAFGSSQGASGGGASGNNTQQPIFPIDFFEHCTVMTDVEYGGNDLLQIYNAQQLRNRLNSTGLYVMSTKQSGFTLEIINNDSNMVITGIRIQVGSQDPQRGPLAVTIHNRIIYTLVLRPRWFDIPLTREESLLSDKKLLVLFGSSADSERICMLDSVKVYGKTKDVFGWPEDSEDVGTSNGPSSSGQPGGGVNGTGKQSGVDDRDVHIQTITPLDRMITSMLDVLDSGLTILGGSTILDDTIRQKAINVATSMLLYPTPGNVQMHARYVLATLHGNKAAYHAYKDREILLEVCRELRVYDGIDAKAIDPEAFFRLVLMVRNIAVARPQTLAKISVENQFDLLPSLLKLMKRLHGITPSYEEPCSIIKKGLSHIDTVVHSLIDIIYAFAISDAEQIEPMTRLFVELLLDSTTVISHSAKQAMIRLLRPRIKRRRVIIGTPPTCTTPTPLPTASVPTAIDDYNMQEVDGIEPLGLEMAAGGNQPAALASLEALLGVGAGLPQLLDLQQDADEEAIMEIAIALSLQDHDADLQSLGLGLANLQGVRGNALQRLQALSGQVASGEGGAAAGGGGTDASTSAGGSDEEGSTAATDGSTLRTSPAEHAGSGGSESGGSGAESFGGTSGRSSTYGDQPNQSLPQNELQRQSSLTRQREPEQQEPDDSSENEMAMKLHVLRYSILDKMIDNFRSLDNVHGIQAIPFMQVVLMLTADLDGTQEIDQNVINKLLNVLISRLEMNPSSQASQMSVRSSKTEVQLVLLRFVGVLMGKVKSISKSSVSGASLSGVYHHAGSENATFVASATANALMKNGAIPYCLVILESFLPYWKDSSNYDEQSFGSVLTNGGSSSSGSVSPPTVTISGAPATTNNLLKATQYGPIPDLQPFFVRQFERGSLNVFRLFPLILTEMVVRLPYQILKLSSGHPSSYDCYHPLCEYMTYNLCEYMMFMQSPVLRRQVRKLLLYICGSKDKYRQLRDIHALDTHMKAVKKSYDTAQMDVLAVASPIGSGTTLSYDLLVDLTEHLRACQEVASVRTGNWQRFCMLHTDILPSLMRISCCQLHEGVAPIILQLLQAAVCNMSPAVNSSAQSTAKDIVTIKSSTNAALKDRRDRDKSEETECSADSKFDPTHCQQLVAQIFGQVSPVLITKFIKNFLLETNSTALRWQAHSLIYALYGNSTEQQKEQLLSHLWSLWPILPAFGRRTAQFVDLLGFLTLSTRSISNRLLDYTAQAVSVLRQQNELLAKHPNGSIYTALNQVLEVDGFYLESEPCLVCNNPEMPMSNIKLSSIKIDSKFTTTMTIVKLVQSHTISKIILRIADLKRTKMVRTINIYYNNRTVQAVVELKNRPAMWHRARKVTLQSGQTDVKIDFPLPITACNLMIEYVDFYETVTGSSESLQCPRCSAAVPANPGVCSNCGENVFQCHKCRAINYDEKDPFLCHSCGFCKYAKFDYSIFGRPCCAVDPIESSDDRAKTVQTIHTSLEKADRVYKQLQANKQILELLVQRISEHKVDRGIDETLIGSVVGTSQVNKVIQLLAQKYCVESKASFDELSKIIQKVQACRRELVAYDRSQMDMSTALDASVSANSYRIVAMNQCYGCALASTEQCLTLLRAMASNIDCRIGLCSQGLVEELAQNNLRRGTSQIQDEVRHVLCLLTKDLPDATKSLCTLINDRVTMALSGTVPLANLDAAVRHEMALLDALTSSNDSNWEMKFKTVLSLFLLACKDTRGPAIAVIQPCLRIVKSLIAPPPATSKINKDLTAQELSTVLPDDTLSVDFQKWLENDPSHSFDEWKARMPKVTSTNSRKASTPMNDDSAPPPPKRTFRAMLEEKRVETRTRYLYEKYGHMWHRKTLRSGMSAPPLQLIASWLQSVLFNTNSRMARQLACSLVMNLARTDVRKQEVINLLTSFLCHIGEAGEASGEFIRMYRILADEPPWRQYLALRGVLTLIADLLTIEIDKIHRLEKTTLSSDLAQGYALFQLVELMSMFLEKPSIRQTYKGRLLGPVLQGYLSLRKLVVQRTRLVDEAQEKLLEMLEEMTTGTEDETRAFMAVLIDTVRKTPMDDIKTPVFIFERLCSIIHPEENDVGEFFLTLEKDPQQEDFLQGRMLGNPYPSSEAGLGPLMRDVKNKICMDCELVALLDDDNGMELLVHNKIISLDLPVKEVYKRVWLSEGGERDAMRVVYRMRGLLGDATEEFVETLSNKTIEEVDTEQLYRMANVLADCGGLTVMLDRIASLQNPVSRSRPLLQVLLKLFLLSVKVRRCQEVLCQPEQGAINTLLKVLQLCLQSENDTAQQSAVTEPLLEIMETILSKASSDTLDSFLQFSLTFGGPEYMQALISCTNCSNVRTNQSVLRHLIRVLAALVYGNDIKMALLCEHFKETLSFYHFDTERNAEDEFKMELFCVLTNQIEHNSIGGTLKDYIISLGIVDKALAYISTHAPCVKPTLLRTDSDELKEFISRPSLKYILRFLTGLATKHEPTQIALSRDTIPIIHRLEQVSSDEHVGSLAENLLEALCTDAATATRVQEVRDFTRTEKKRLAMATREKQLDALGMRTNEKGQVTAKGSILQKIEKLRDETGLTCFICREGYACQPTKVLGIYTFTKRTAVEEYEQKLRKMIGYATVTHFNVVHIDCHMSAIRLARSRDEWESASLQNANTRCNGLLPLWGPDVTESAFSSCMSRHNAYMQESTQRCEITFSSAVHDLKLLLQRFAHEKSFHEDAGGGGPQSNMHLVPYLLFYALYNLLSSRSFSREEKTLSAYLAVPAGERWLESSYDVEGPLYQITLSLALHTGDVWRRNRIQHLRRMLATALTRDAHPSYVCTLTDRSLRVYEVYKPYLMFWALVDLIYRHFFRTVTTPKEEDWPISLFDYIRRNDEAMLKASDTVLGTFTDEYLTCTTFYEFCDVAELLNEIENPDDFLYELLLSLPAEQNEEC